MELPLPDRQDASPEAGSPASLPLLVIGPSCICHRKGGLDAETEGLVDGDPRAGAAGSACCDPVVARQRFHGKDEAEERPAPSQPSAWSWPAGIEEQEGVRSDSESRRSFDAVGDPVPAGASRSPQLYCVTHDLVLMHCMAEAMEEKLGREGGSKKGMALHAPGPSAAPTREPDCPRQRVTKGAA
jgi:hypothetical protein